MGVGDGITRAEAVSVLNAAVAAGVVADDTEQTPWGSAGAASGSGYETSAQAQAQAASNDDTTAIDVQSITDGASSADGKAIVETAMRGLGGNYVWGGTAYKNWDCSGFTQWVYAQNGVSIPRVTWQQFGAAQKTSTPQVGDLVSQNNGSHVGIYLGDGLMISALNPDQGTLVHPVNAMKVDGFYTFL
nr:C40 family peptidase [Kocuria palustris]